MKKTFLIFIAIIFVLSSCKKTLDLSITDAEKKIVINGILYPDSIVRVNISRSLGVLEEDSTEFQFLNKATAKLYENDNYIETLVFDSLGFYHSTIIPDLTKKYKLEVESEGIEKAIGRVEFIKSVPFTITDVESFVIDSTITVSRTSDWNEEFEPYDTTFQYANVNCKLSFEDPLETNFYVIQVYSYCFNMGYFESYENGEFVLSGFYLNNDSKMQKIYANYSIENNNTLIENYTFYGVDYDILQDDLFNGQTLSLNLDIDFTTFDLQPVYIKMYSVPKNYIDYSKSENKYWQANGNPFAQPVNVFSNIENGFGIFTAFGLHEQVITLN